MERQPTVIVNSMLITAKIISLAISFVTAVKFTPVPLVVSGARQLVPMDVLVEVALVTVTLVP